MGGLTAAGGVSDARHPCRAWSAVRDPRLNEPAGRRVSTVRAARASQAARLVRGGKACRDRTLRKVPTPAAWVRDGSELDGERDD